MVEPQFVVLDVAGSSPVGHPTFFFPLSDRLLFQECPSFGHWHLEEKNYNEADDVGRPRLERSLRN